MVDRSRGGAFGFVAEIPSPRHDAGARCLIEGGSGAESTMFSDTEHYGVTAGLYKLDPRLRPGYPPKRTYSKTDYGNPNDHIA